MELESLGCGECASSFGVRTGLGANEVGCKQGWATRLGANVAGGEIWGAKVEVHIGCSELLEGVTSSSKRGT